MRLDTNWGTVNIPSNPSFKSLENHEVITAFTCGHCHSFALAVHDLTGWQLVGLYRSHRSMNATPHHVVIRMPNGKLFDINGIKNFSDYATKKDFTRDEVAHFHDYRPPKIRSAKPFAERLLQKLGTLPLKKKRASTKKLQISFAFE